MRWTGSPARRMPGSNVGGTHGAKYSNSAGYGTLRPNEVFMHKVLILGAGKIGALISGLLAESGDYDVTLGDVDATTAEAVVKAHGSRAVRAVPLDPGNAKALEQHFTTFKPHAVISSLPYYCNPAVAK